MSFFSVQVLSPFFSCWRIPHFTADIQVFLLHCCYGWMNCINSKVDFGITALVIRITYTRTHAHTHAIHFQLTLQVCHTDTLPLTELYQEKHILSPIEPYRGKYAYVKNARSTSHLQV